MASSSSYNNGSNDMEMEEMWKKLSLTEDKNVEISFDDIEVENDDSDNQYKWCLVGKLFTNRSYSVPHMKSTLAGLWRPQKGVMFEDIVDNMFRIQFFHEIDYKKVIEGGPWTLKKHLFAMKELTGGEQSSQLRLDVAYIWVQVHDIPFNIRSIAHKQKIGSLFKEFVKADEKDYREYIRLRVGINLDKPLLRGTWLPRKNDKAWVKFKYEKLPNYCYVCGYLGHVEDECDKVFSFPALLDALRQYPSELLRAQAGRRIATDAVGERWLVKFINEVQQKQGLKKGQGEDGNYADDGLKVNIGSGIIMDSEKGEEDFFENVTKTKATMKEISQQDNIHSE
ncbi:unnamed protein product [Amaranthus hypochondriacus]